LRDVPADAGYLGAYGGRTIEPSNFRTYLAVFSLTNKLKFCVFDIRVTRHNLFCRHQQRWRQARIGVQSNDCAPPPLGKLLESFKEFPPRQKSASFSIDKIAEPLMPKN
jgi:hypothetical protein